MIRKGCTIAGLVCALFAVWDVRAPSAQMAQDELTIPINRSELIRLPEDVDEVVVANADIADVVVHGKTRVSVIGMNIGKTNLRIFDEDGDMLRNTVVNVTYDLPEIRKALKNFFPYEDIGVELVNDNVAVTGVISDAEIANQAVRIVEEYLSESRTTRQEERSVINLAKIRSGQQVMLRVRVGEIERTVTKNLGIDLSAGKQVGNFNFLMDVGEAASGNYGSFGVDFNAGGASLSTLLDALESEGLFKILAEPNLVAVSGERAEFLSGGEFPIPVAQGDGAVSVQFREYGVGVQFTPIVISNNRLRLVVQPEVSELSGDTVIVDGSPIPGLLSRRVRTTVELAPGESFMIAGLIVDNSRTTVEEVPGIAEIPILSSLFRRANYERRETELVIAVTPYLVDPVSGTDIRLPSEDMRHASMMEQFFYGSMSPVHSDALTISQTPAVEGPIGFMVE